MIHTSLSIIFPLLDRDFSLYRMERIAAIRFVGGEPHATSEGYASISKSICFSITDIGFAMAGSVSPEEYFDAQVDPVASFAGPVMKHMNEDHAEATAAMVAHHTGLSCTSAAMVGIDRYGFTVSKR